MYEISKVYIKERISHRLYLILFIVFMQLTLSLSGTANYVYAAEESKPVLVYFYFSVCAQCQEAEKALNEMAAAFKNKNLPDVRMYNVEDSNNYQLLDKYYEEYRVPEENRIMPVLFAGSEYYAGKKQITEGLKSLIKKDSIGSTPLLKTDSGDNTAAEMKLSSLGMINVFFTGLINGFNPCSLSMLLFLVSLLLARKASVVKMGLSFAAGKFIMYLLLGTVLFSLLGRLHGGWFNSGVKIFLIIFMFVIALLNVNDFFAARKEKYGDIKNQLPKGLRKFNHDKIKRFLEIADNRALILFCFFLGTIISVGEFLCTGQMYLATIALVVQSDSRLNSMAFLYLFVYVAAFILPLLAVIFLISRGKDTFQLSEALRARLPLIKAVSACMFFLFGVLLLVFFNW